MKEEKISIYRVLPILGIFCSALAASGALCYFHKLEFDQILCVLFVIIGFMPIIVFELEYERHRNMIGNNTKTDYKRIALGFFITCVVIVAISFMPEYFRPVLILPLIMSAFSNETLGITTSLFANVLLAMTTGGSYNELLAYTMLVIIGGVLAKALSMTEYRMYISLIYLFVSVMFPSVFYYLNNETIVLTNLIICTVNGFVVAIFATILYPKTKQVTEEEIKHFYNHLLEEEYIQVREVHAYSLSEYNHARKVSDIAFKYASQLDLNADLAAAAGFYYRLGRWEGEPFIENSIKKANELCFPVELIQILKEYYGEEELPSTPESALVHIIDGLLIKLELLEKEVGTSQWNREVLIYQTLNEFSTAGLYDKSGLSINAFIKIREWLAKEELL